MCTDIGGNVVLRYVQVWPFLWGWGRYDAGTATVGQGREKTAQRKARGSGDEEKSKKLMGVGPFLGLQCN